MVMDFSEQNSIDRQYYQKDFISIKVLLNNIRQSFITGKEICLLYTSDAADD